MKQPQQHDSVSYSRCWSQSGVGKLLQQEEEDEEEQESNRSPSSSSSSWYLSDDSERSGSSNNNNNEVVIQGKDGQIPTTTTTMGEKNASTITTTRTKTKPLSSGFNLTLLLQHYRNGQDEEAQRMVSTWLADPSAMDVGLAQILPLSVLEHSESFLQTPRQLYSSSSSPSSTNTTTTPTSSTASATPMMEVEDEERLIYVTQAELAHATPDQCDVLVSDRATTCHVLALYSRRQRRRKQHQQQQPEPTAIPSSLPLASLTHLDGTSYESCIRNMILQHKQHHHFGDNNTATNNINNDDYEIIMDIHICGGFEDERGLSRELSNWLLILLLQLAMEEMDHDVIMILQTCAMTCLNNQLLLPTNVRSGSVMDDDDDMLDDGCMGSSSPRGRGMAMNVRTGQVRLAHVVYDDESLAGPLLPLRLARLWTTNNNNSPRTLTLVHTNECSVATTTNDDDNGGSRSHLNSVSGGGGVVMSEFIIEPFVFGPTTCVENDLEYLLSLPDDLLLQQTSTSPLVEEDDYCHLVRQSLCVIRDWDCHALFGPHCDQKLTFQRVK